jgi:hypothetical protein
VSYHLLIGFGACGKIIRKIENTRRLKFGYDCLPVSGRRSRKPVNRKSKLKDGGDATPSGVEVSISRRDLSVAESAFANENQKARWPEIAAPLRRLSHWRKL